MIVIGLTGSFGTGKSTVARMLKELGARVLDADTIAHDLIRPGRNCWRKIVHCFGLDILNKNQSINRDKLAKIVFKKRQDLRKLEEIIHPLVIREIAARLGKIENSRKNEIVVIDAPLLIEAGLAKKVDTLIVVKLNRTGQIARALKQKGISRAQILKRIRSQLPLSKKIAIADYVIDNNRRKNDTRRQVKKIWEEIKNG